MRYRILIILLAFMSLQSCKKDQSAIPNIYWGEVTAIKNGEVWTGKIYAQSNEPFDGFTIRVDVYDKWEFQREALFLAKIPYKEQRNLIDTIKASVDTTLTGASYATLVDDGDVLGDIFKVYGEKTDNHVTITSYNERTKEVKGEFQVTLIFDKLDSRSDPSAPDTIRFTNGKFHTKIKDK